MILDEASNNTNSGFDDLFDKRIVQSKIFGTERMCFQARVNLQNERGDFAMVVESNTFELVGDQRDINIAPLGLTASRVGAKNEGLGDR